MKNLLAILILCLAPSLVFGQLDIQIKQVKGITGLSGVTRLNDYLFVDAKSKPELKDMTLLRVNPKAKVKIENLQRERVLIDELEKHPGVYVFTEAGTYIVDVRLIDWDAKEEYEDTVKVIVKSSAPKVPEDATHKDLLTQIRTAVGELDKPTREVIASVIAEASDGLRSFKFRQTSDAADYIKKNRPTGPGIDRLFKLLSQDAQARAPQDRKGLQAYYNEISQFIRPKEVLQYVPR